MNMHVTHRKYAQAPFSMPAGSTGHRSSGVGRTMDRAVSRRVSASGRYWIPSSRRDASY
jgi:hypothetical protein